MIFSMCKLFILLIIRIIARQLPNNLQLRLKVLKLRLKVLKGLKYILRRVRLAKKKFQEMKQNNFEIIVLSNVKRLFLFVNVVF